eukprot:31176-Pelagococcus_subviridis.AAC.17
MSSSELSLAAHRFSNASSFPDVRLERVHAVRGDVAPPADGLPLHVLGRGLHDREETVVKRRLRVAFQDHHARDEHLHEPEQGAAAVRLFERLAGSPRVEPSLVLPYRQRDVVVLVVRRRRRAAHALDATHEREETEPVQVREPALALGPTLLERRSFAALKLETVRRDVPLRLELAFGQDRGADLGHDVRVRADDRHRPASGD